ncbi:unnamed protein product [Rotaria socialis]|uniref:Uncharacterized protein n=1 Tax=Rotaria socialis TaxID=392032 RepID=A0A821GSS4_9BILA|nr:unnamed protein product [Rotaria socialis]
MEWIISKGGPSTSLEVDIGYMPRMELRSAAPSISLNGTGITSEQLIATMNENLRDNLLKSFNSPDENFANEKEVFDLLERKFYPFKAVRKILESSAVLNLLREQFVSTWALVVDLKAIIGNQSDDTIKDAQRAKQALDNYAFPVESIIQQIDGAVIIESMIQQIDGTVISKINANDLLNINSQSEQFVNVIADEGDTTIKRYVHFLEQALNHRQN